MRRIVRLGPFAMVRLRRGPPAIRRQAGWSGGTPSARASRPRPGAARPQKGFASTARWKRAAAPGPWSRCGTLARPDGPTGSRHHSTPNTGLLPVSPPPIPREGRRRLGTPPTRHLWRLGRDAPTRGLAHSAPREDGTRVGTRIGRGIASKRFRRLHPRTTSPPPSPPSPSPAADVRSRPRSAGRRTEDTRRLLGPRPAHHPGERKWNGAGRPTWARADTRVAVDGGARTRGARIAMPEASSLSMCDLE